MACANSGFASFARLCSSTSAVQLPKFWGGVLGVYLWVYALEGILLMGEKPSLIIHHKKFVCFPLLLEEMQWIKKCSPQYTAKRINSNHDRNYDNEQTQFL